MNGPISQIVALTCHANAFLRGRSVPELFPGHSTCQFCDHVKFLGFNKSIFGKVSETQVAANPNRWFEYLKSERIAGVRLRRTSQNDAGISDRMSAAFVGGGGSWAMETISATGWSSTWMARWGVWNQTAPEHRIWRVDYGRVAEGPIRKFEVASLDSVAKRFQAALTEIHTFAERHNCGGFTACFARGMETLDSGGAKRLGFHKDLSPQGDIPELAAALLDAAQSAWVFGGMGSWNDMGFDGADQKEYDRVSEQLFTEINEAIETGANASFLSEQ